MPDFLLELLTEEIPARMQAKAAEQLGVRFGDGIKGKLPGGTIETFVTPRRLILIARGLGAAGNDTEEERRGPRADAPAQALEGFLRSTGLTRDQLEERDTPKGKFLYATIRAPGRSAAEVIAELVPQIVRDFDWPKSMRWGGASTSTASPRWVRPLSSIVALLDGKVVPFEAAGIPSGRTTRGHRFMARDAIEVGSAATYADQLRAAYVLIDPAERQQIIADGARAAATARGVTLIEDAGLVAENAGLTEWPVPLLGDFDPEFLDVPREVIQLTMRTNQKYFACTDSAGALAPVFVCVANLDAPDGGATIVAGNRKVLAARLSDAKFFWDQDRAITLEARLPKLADIVFHEKLGTVADKVERVAKLARWLVESGAVPNADADLAEQAARLCKADLVSATVGEFPEVQGIAGRYLALAEGLDPQVADAIGEQYGLNAYEPISVSVSLADRVDTISSFFRIDERPTGSRDPFAVRRAGLGVIFLILARSVRVDLFQVVTADVFEFLVERWKFQNREAGGRPDLIDAVVSVANDGDLHRLGLRMRALEAFIATDDGTNLLAGYRRAANILRIEEAKGEAFDGDYDPALLAEPAEQALAAALTSSLADAADAVAREAFEDAMTALSRLRPPVDAFFEAVMVNVTEPELRSNRLKLLASFRAAVHNVADFSKIV